MIDFRPRDAKHVALSLPCTLACRHCGDQVVMTPPVSVRSLTAIAQAYADVHRDCVREFEHFEDAVLNSIARRLEIPEEVEG